MKGTLWGVFTLCAATAFSADFYWEGGGADADWNTAANWSTDVIPNAGDRVFMDVEGETILVKAGDFVSPRKIIGPCENSIGTIELVVEGELNNDSYWYMGSEVGGEGVLTINGGTVNTRDLVVAGGNSYSGTVNVNSGLLNIYGNVGGTGAYFGSDPSSGISTGDARINLVGGILQLALLNSMGSNAIIDISYGQIILDGDQRSLVNGYVLANKIKAFDGDGQILVDYDLINVGKTTVYAGGDIQDAITNVPAGSTLFIPPGTYNGGQFNIDKSLTIKSVTGPEQTIINVASNGISIIADNVTLDGFTINNQVFGSTYLIRVGKSVSNVSYPVSNCRIVNCILDGSNVAQGITIYDGNYDINIFSNSVSNCVNGLVIYDNSTHVRIIDNEIMNNSYGMRVLGSVDELTVMSNGIYWNSTLGLSSTGVSVLNAENNYWGHSTGPYHELSNVSGKGNNVSGNVDFIPYFLGAQSDKWHICPEADLNNDCVVNFWDFIIIAEQWLNCNGLDCE